MTDVVDLDAAGLVSREDEQARSDLIRKEGLGLLDFYKQVEDADVRWAIYNLLKSISSERKAPIADR